MPGQQDEQGLAPYSALWQFPPERGTEAYVEDQLAVWLREKDIDVDLAQTRAHHFGESRLFIGRHESGGAPEFQARLVEQNREGVWRTELTTHAPEAAGGWLRLRVTHNHRGYVAPPRLAGYLLARGDFRDGGALDLTESPTVVSSSQAQEVAEVITDFTREGLVFVAGTDTHLPFDPFLAQVKRWTRDVVGLAEVYVLDPNATREMAEILGEWHQVQPWTIRTFLPDVDPAVEANASMHRWLTTYRLEAASVGYIQRTLGRVARDHAEARALPDNVMHSLRAFVRLENQYLVESVGRLDRLESRFESVLTEPAAPSDKAAEAAVEESATDGDSVADQAARNLRALGLVRQILDLPEVTEESLRAYLAGLNTQEQETRAAVGQRLDEQETEIARLTEEVGSLRHVVDEAELELAIAAEENARLADLEVWLRTQRTADPQADLSSAALPEWERTLYPTSFDGLLAALERGDFEKVVFTGNAAETSVLDPHSGLGTSLRTAFDVVQALRDYAKARAGDWQGNVDTYLRNPPKGGRSVPLKKHASTESETVMSSRRLKRTRTFPVPLKEGSTDSVSMFAHFKLGLSGSISPRLYYLDDTANSGNVYIGYIGKHLENTKTN